MNETIENEEIETIEVPNEENTEDNTTSLELVDSVSKVNQSINFSNTIALCNGVLLMAILCVHIVKGFFKN